MYYFETIKCEDYEVFNIAYHEKRVANTIGMNLNLGEYIYPPSSKLLRCKVIYDDSGITSVEFFPYTKRNIQSFKIVHANELDYSKKYLDRTALDNLFEKRDDADEIIIVKDGFITDTSIANITIFDGDNWLTPKKPLLYGTTRARLIYENEIIEKDITVEMLQEAKKIALLNAMIGMDVLKDYCLYL